MKCYWLKSIQYDVHKIWFSKSMNEYTHMVIGESKFMLKQ